MAKSKGIPGTITDPKMALAYMLQPNTNIITFQSAKTGERRTFRVKPMDRDAVKANGIVGQRFFVSFLSGPENTRDYTYLGQILNGKFMLTQKSQQNGITEQTPSFMIFKVAFETLLNSTVMPKMLQVTHSGRCGKCHKALTVPKSVNDGFGPECVNSVYSTSPCPLPTIDTTVLRGVQRKVDGGRMNGRQVAEALYAPALKTALENSLKEATFVVCGFNVTRELDAQINAKIEEYKAMGPENYWQDGEVEEPEAFNCAYRMFYHELTGKQ